MGIESTSAEDLVGRYFNSLDEGEYELYKFFEERHILTPESEGAFSMIVGNRIGRGMYFHGNRHSYD